MCDSACVGLRSGFTHIEMSEEDKTLARDVAERVLLSRCEWTWTEQEQAAMAFYALWLTQRLSTVRDIASGKAINAREVSDDVADDSGTQGVTRERPCFSCGSRQRPKLEMSPAYWLTPISLCRVCAGKPHTVRRTMHAIASTLLEEVARFAGKEVADYDDV